MTSTDIERTTPQRMGLEEQIAYAKAMAEANLLPEAYRKQPANVLIAMQAGEALGITPFQAIQGIDVISGTMSMSAEMMRALVHRAGHTLRIDALTDKGCRILAARRTTPDDVQAFEFTELDAQRAGLTGPNYKKHPKAMLLARCTTLTCRAVFADVIGGFSATEELVEAEQVGPRKSTAHLAPDTAPPGVDVDTGEVVEADLVDEEPQPTLTGDRDE